MTNASKNAKEFDFLKDSDDMKAWVDNQEELDRQWYDADEEGHLAGDDDYTVSLEQ